ALTKAHGAVNWLTGPLVRSSAAVTRVRARARPFPARIARGRLGGVEAAPSAARLTDTWLVSVKSWRSCRRSPGGSSRFLVWAIGFRDEWRCALDRSVAVQKVILDHPRRHQAGAALRKEIGKALAKISRLDGANFTRIT